MREDPKGYNIIYLILATATRARKIWQIVGEKVNIIWR
jgi:hypothetical protein